MNIYESIAAIMQDVPAIGKEKKNKEQGFMYRGIDDVMNALQPLLSRHKVFVVPEVLEQVREERVAKSGRNLLYSLLKIKYTFYAEDGTSVSAVVIGEGMDSADKASNKAMAVGLKYALFQIFCIPTEEMIDPDSECPEDSKPGKPAIPPEPEQPCHCETCGKQIRDAKNPAGEVWRGKDIATYSWLKYKKKLCISCLNQAKAAEAQAGEADEIAG